VWALGLFFFAAAAYQCLALLAACKYVWNRTQAGRKSKAALAMPGVSVLKPLRGLDPNTYEAFRSQVLQDYPQFEILFGVADERDPAVAEVRRLQQEFPDVSIRLLITGPVEAANGKVGVLMHLAEKAQYPIWVVNDSDIKVTPDYLRAVTAPLADPTVGIVTCPYRVHPHNLPAAWEALGIATDFIPSALVAQLLGVREFGFGSTLAFRAADLKQAGGFSAIAGYLADDYQLAKRITSLGKRACLSTYTVETALAGATWSGVWRHQIRWARTIRVSKGRGYAGLFLTHAGIWVLIALAASAPLPAVILLLFRIGSALLTSAGVLRSRLIAKICWLAPLWDLYAFAIWVSSYFGNQVYWRDRVLRVGPDGRIEEVTAQAAHDRLMT
jgi:ceramide glucosyltransferase